MKHNSHQRIRLPDDLNIGSWILQRTNETHQKVIEYYESDTCNKISSIPGLRCRWENVHYLFFTSAICDPSIEEILYGIQIDGGSDANRYFWLTKIVEEKRLFLFAVASHLSAKTFYGSQRLFGDRYLRTTQSILVPTNPVLIGIWWATKNPGSSCSATSKWRREDLMEEDKRFLRHYTDLRVNMQSDKQAESKILRIGCFCAYDEEKFGGWTMSA